MLDNNYTKQVIAEINKSQGASLNFIIKDLIKTNSGDSARMKNLWDEYKGIVPIKKDPRVANNPAVPDDRVANDFRGLIVQQAVGYMFGNSVKYILDEEEEDTENYTEAENLIKTFLKRSQYEKIDAETETYLATCGKGFRIMYYQDWENSAGETSVQLMQKNIKPWEAIVINNNSVDEPEFGLIYYQVEVNGIRGMKKYRTKVEWYDKTNVYYFHEDAQGNFYPDDTYGVISQPHGFNFMPLIKFSNNLLELGDFEKQRQAIDGYDRLISYGLQDMRSFAAAYLIFYGVEPTPEVMDAARKTGAFYVPRDNDSDANNNVEYLTKDLAINNITDLATTINADIFRFSACVSMSDESFAGSAAIGEARKWKMLGLEMKCKEKERLYKEGLQRLFKVAATFWSKVSGIKIDYEDMRFVFVRSMPVDLSVADVVALKTAGILSVETALESIRAVDNAGKEAEKAMAENSGTVVEQTLPRETTDFPIGNEE